MAFTQDEVNQLVQEAAAQAGGTLSYADVMNAAASLGIPASQVASAMSTGVITDSGAPAPTGGGIAALPSAPVISYTPPPDSEGSQSVPGIYEINGKTVNPIYKTTVGAGGDDPSAGMPTSNVAGFTGGIERINGQDVVADYDASGNLLGYRPYAGESFFGGVVKPLLPIIASAVAPGLGNLIGGATGLTGAQLAAATGATTGGGLAALTGQNVLKGALLGGAAGYAGSSLGSATPGSGAIDTNGWDMASAANYDAGLQGVGNNLGGLSDLQLAQMYDQGLFGVGSNLGGLSDLQLAELYDRGLIGVGSNVGPDFALAQAYDEGLTGVGENVGANSLLPQADYSNEGRNYPTEASTKGSGGSPINASMAAAAGVPAGLGTAAKLAAAALGAKGVQSLLTPQGTGTMGPIGDGFNPLGGYNFDPARFQASVPDPAMFRPTMGVVTVADAIRQAQERSQGVQAMAEGGSTKPKYTAKSKLAAMSPWERAAAQLNNAAFVARMPVGVSAPQASVSQLGQFAAGGGISDLGSYSDGGRMLKGAGDGMSDSIPATIGGKRPARLADGEFVVPADVVSGLGNGSTDAGAKQLYKMMDRVRQARTGTKKQGKEINAPKHLPA